MNEYHLIPLKAAASQLVDAHRKLSAARRAMQEAEAEVHSAEHVFLTESGAREFGVTQLMICKGHALRVKEDYYEAKKGEQVEVTAVQVIG